MHADAPTPNSDTRLRLLALRVGAVERDFGGGLACVPVSVAQRPDVAATIAGAVIGPRPQTTTGTIEIAGRLVALESLPAPLLRPSATPIVDRPVLDSLWHEVCVQHRSRIESAHAAARLVRHRVGAALERAHERARELAALAEAAARTPAIAIAPEPQPEPEDEIDIEPEAPAADELADRIEALLDEFDALEPVAPPAAGELADAFDRLAVADPAPVADMADVDFAALEARIAAARVAVARASGGVHPEAKVRIEECHRAVVEAESALFEARRKERAEALARYQQALAAEHAALAEGGIDSYASFLVAIAAGAAPIDLEARLRAELELADASAELQRAQELAERADPAGIDDEVELRAKAAQLLGHFPGENPGDELRALRLEHPHAEVVRERLVDLLHDAGATATGDIVADARHTLEQRRLHPPVVAAPEPPEHAPTPVADPMADAVPLGALDADLAREQLELHEHTATLTRECEEHERELANLEAELAYVDRVKVLDVAAIELDAFASLIDALFDCYRAGDLLAGRLPVVVDGAFDDLDGERRWTVVSRLRALDDIQVIVVTGDTPLARDLEQAGARTVEWSRPGSPPPSPGFHDNVVDVAAAEAADSHPAETGPCALHPEKVGAAQCSQCGRASCLECLVYVPGEPELWCTGCAEARSRHLRLLRRRGA